MTERPEAGPHCPACGQPVPAGAEYCPYCSETLPSDCHSADPSTDMSSEVSDEDLEDEEGSEYQRVHWSSDTDEWSTPPELLRTLGSAVDGFDLDPCSGAEERSIAPETYTEEEDGLSQPWYGTVWCNFPYSDSDEWLEKAWSESQRDRLELALLLAPARTSTNWFHKYATRATALCFIEGRLRFGDADNSAPFPSVLLAFGELSDQLYGTLNRLGTVYVDGEKYSATRQTSLDALANGGDP